MKILKIAIVVAATALMTSPAWALQASPTGMAPNQGQNGGKHDWHNDPNQGNQGNPGNQNQGDQGDQGNHGDRQGNQGDHHKHHGRPSYPGHSHRCIPHNVAYVATGTLLKQALSQDTNAKTYSGTLEVAVEHTNRHAASDRKTTKTYTVEHVRVTFALEDVNKNGSIGLDDVQANDRVLLIGKITSLSKKCDQTGFTPTLTIRHIVLYPPAHS